MNYPALFIHLFRQESSLRGERDRLDSSTGQRQEFLNVAIQ